MSQLTELLKLVPMERIVEALKYASAALTIVAPAVKVFFGRGRGRARELEERHTRLKSFFVEGGLKLDPLRMESAFGAVVGHTRLDAVEIPLIVKQTRPTSFMSSYLKVRGYLAPNSDGTAFELRSIAASKWLRRLFSGAGFVFYILFLLSAFWLLFYLAPKMATDGNWVQFLLTLPLAVLFAAVGAYSLYIASHPYWAKRLFESQVKPSHSNRRHA